jgi:predicted nucleic acid-binding protein
MPDFNFKSAAQLAQPVATLSRRADSQLPFLTAAKLAGPGIVLDTCVYIDQLQGRLDPVVEKLIENRHTHHSSVAIQELMHSVGALNPDHAGTMGVIIAIEKLIQSMPAHRIVVPDINTLGSAAVLSGVLCRIQGYQNDQRQKALQDCVLFLQAQKDGLTLVTRNIKDFDYLLQLRPEGRVLMYRQRQ